MTAEYNGLPNHWEIRRLDEVATIIDSLHKTPTYSHAGRPMIRVADVQGGFLKTTGALRVSDDVFGEFTRRYKPKRGDIVFSRVGSYGNASYVNTDEDFCVGQNTALLLPRINGRFLHLFLQSAEARRQIDDLAVGSTQKTISLKSIAALKIPVPPNDELEAIAAVLGALDDKIELNRRMNATLEATARALFQSWFVDFDPVRAKLDRRQPTSLYLSTAGLFPNQFEDSELGEIPRGWRVGPLGEFVELHVDRVDATPAKDNKRYIALEDMPSKSIDISIFQLGSAVNSSIIAFRKGDVLFGSMRPYFHKVGLAFFDGITRTTTFVLRPKKDCFRHFALLHFFSDDVVAYSSTASVGTTIPYVKWNSLESYIVAIPPDPVLAAFEKIVGPLVQRIAEHGEESRTLAAVRDTLLPRLLSGKKRTNRPLPDEIGGRLESAL
jgi:type I restriction enzyme S subunit